MRIPLGFAFATVLFIAVFGASLGIQVKDWGYFSLFVTLFFFAGAFKYLLETGSQDPEYSKAMISHQILEIAKETLPFLRTGLNGESAGKVAQIIWKRTDAIAVSLTDSENILAFRGVGESHHEPGKPILTRATEQTLTRNSISIINAQDEIGCPVPKCPLRAAIIVPLSSRGQAIGTLKFYYASSDKLTQSHITIATGLGALLSSQLELSEIDKQAKLATQAQLRSLQSQINPHFLFNTLNTIAMFCRTKPNEARRLLIEFAEFFRASLERDRQHISVREELDYVNSYLVFERARFGDQLHIFEHVDPKALDCMMPVLTLQPLVENAVKHGAGSESSLEIEISVKLVHGVLVISVKDNGVGIAKNDLPHIFEPGFGRGIGVGLNNVKERLDSIYGIRSSLNVRSRPNLGTTVTMRIPVNESSTSEVANEA